MSALVNGAAHLEPSQNTQRAKYSHLMLEGLDTIPALCEYYLFRYVKG
jgi:hypothetical protein